MCLILVTYYSGSLTSVVIHPTRDYRMTRIGNLRGGNFSLILRYDLAAVVKNLVKMSGYRTEAGEILSPLINSSKVAPSEDALAEMITTMERHIFIALWPPTIQATNLAEAYMSNNHIYDKKCYVGEQLFFHQNMFIVMSPPNSLKLGGIVTLMMESGIYAVWFNEYVGISASLRVQERSKMLSRTKLLEEKVQPKALKLLEGKVKNILFLWITCLSVSGIVFVAEITVNKLKAFFAIKVEQY